MDDCQYKKKAKGVSIGLWSYAKNNGEMEYQSDGVLG
jgi:hypothetical protein